MSGTETYWKLTVRERVKLVECYNVVLLDAMIINTKVVPFGGANPGESLLQARVILQ